MTEPGNKQEKAITKRLDVIIRILMEEQRFLQKISKSEQLLTLHSSGLTPSEMAPIIGWAASNVRTNVSKLRKKAIKKSNT
jgi:hypothetical protein